DPSNPPGGQVACHGGEAGGRPARGDRRATQTGRPGAGVHGGSRPLPRAAANRCREGSLMMGRPKPMQVALPLPHPYAKAFPGVSSAETCICPPILNTLAVSHSHTTRRLALAYAN